MVFPTLDAITHISELAAEHDIEVEGHSSGGRAYRRRRRVKIRPVKSPVTYAIALHELGHILGRNSGRRIDKEVQAWEWAKANALVWTKRMNDTKRDCLISYVRWAERKQATGSGATTYITPGHAIYKEVRQ